MISSGWIEILEDGFVNSVTSSESSLLIKINTMKKILFFLILAGFAVHAKAATQAIKNDTAKVVTDPKLTEYNTKLLKLKLNKNPPKYATRL